MADGSHGNSPHMPEMTVLVTMVTRLTNDTLASNALIFGASEGLYMCHIAPCGISGCVMDVIIRSCDTYHSLIRAP